MLARVPSSVSVIFFVDGFHPAGEETIMPNDVEIMGRNMLNQIFDKFDGSQRMTHFSAVVPIILELKCDKLTGIVHVSEKQKIDRLRMIVVSRIFSWIERKYRLKCYKAGL